tara:strand:- start:71 stop:238 length:168 start_codon:yes stop_codon:yes gene_type:complete
MWSKIMTIKELIKILQELDPNSKAMIDTDAGIEEVKQVSESIDADYNEIYIMGDK